LPRTVERGTCRDAREIVVEEDAGDELLARGDVGLLEQALDVVLDGVGRENEPVGDPSRSLTAATVTSETPRSATIARN